FFAAQPLKSYALTAMVGIGQDEVLAPNRNDRLTYSQAAIAGFLVLMQFAVALTVMSVRLAWKQYKTESIRDTYRSATEGANEGFYLLQALLEKNGEIADFELVDCNERAAALFGTKKAALIGATLSGLYETPYFEKLMEVIRFSMQMGFYEDEYEINSGSRVKAGWLYRKFVKSGHRIAVTLRDITE